MQKSKSIIPDPKTRPSFNEWAKEFNVSRDYIEPQKKNENKLNKPLKPKDLTIWEKIHRVLFG